MQQVLGTRNAPGYVTKATLYICPQGRLMLTLGNQRMQVTPEELRVLVERLLKLADSFSVMNGGNHDELG